MLNIDSRAQLDETDWQLITALQEDARQSFTALGQVVGLSRPAVAERVHRLEDLGIITGYRATIDMSRVGQCIIAFARVRTGTRQDCTLLSAALLDMPEVQECHHITGEDCYIIKLAVRSIAHLETVLDQLRDYGSTTTSIVLSTVVAHRPVVRPAAEALAAM